MSDVKQLYSAAEAVELLREIVAEFGADHINTDPNADSTVTCTYADDEGNPSCIAGQALYRADPELFDAVRQFENANGSAVFNRLPRYMGVDLPFTPLAVMTLRRAQILQDSGENWGFAVEDAAGYAVTQSDKYPDKGED